MVEYWVVAIEWEIAYWHWSAISGIYSYKTHWTTLKQCLLEAESDVVDVELRCE